MEFGWGFIEYVLRLLAWLAFWAAFVGYPAIRILDRAGLTRWMVLGALFPPIFLWILALNNWPATEVFHREAANSRDEWSDAEKETFKRLRENRPLS